MTAPPVLDPYYADESVTLYLGHFREVLASLPDLRFDACVTDPPYGETRLEWDSWQCDWPSLIATVTDSLWCFGSLRMFFDHLAEFNEWRFSQDVVWEKHNGSGMLPDRFRRVHEHATHWYRGAWRDIHHAVPTTPDASARAVRRGFRPSQWQGSTAPTSYVTVEGGDRLMRSVIYARSMHSRSINETEKPLAVVSPLVEYAVPPGGVLLDPFAGSGVAGIAAKLSGRRAVLIELREAQCAKTAERLAQGALDFSEVPVS